MTRAELYQYQAEKNDLKGHADKIIKGIKEISTSHAKRAIWELFQNAVDLSPYCEIEVSITEDELVFSHNGAPFTTHTLDCLFTQVSSKTLKEKKLDREETDPTGQYGTGFMTSHSLGDVVKVSGAILDESGEESERQRMGHNLFQDITMDRSTQDWEKLCDEIRLLRKTVKKLLNEPLTYDELPKTIFRFQLKTELNKKRAKEAIESLCLILPCVMVFNDRLKKVHVTDLDGNSTIYQKDDNIQVLENVNSQIIHINNEKTRINFIKSDRITIVLPLTIKTEVDGVVMTAHPLSEDLPRLFLFYPLIGTEKFGFNFVIHSKNFQPTEPRDGLHLNSDNEKNKIEESANQNLINEATRMIFEFMELNLSGIQNPHFLAEINFNIQTDDIELSKYYTELKKVWTSKFVELPFIETNNTRIPAQKAVFLKESIIYDADPLGLYAIYQLSSKFYSNLPKPGLNPIWTKITNEWCVDNIKQIGFLEICEQIEKPESVHICSKEELLPFYTEIIRKGESDLFTIKALLPNIKGQFRKQLELSRSVNLSEELIKIADTINPKISNRQIDPDFILNGLEFEAFDRKNYMVLINASLDEYIKDATRFHQLPEDYLERLLQYASIVPKDDSDSGPIRVIRLIASHYDLPFTPIVLPTLPGDDNIDVRKGQFDLFKVYLNDVSDKDRTWTESNLTLLSSVLSEAFGNADLKKFFLRYDVYPNQLFELKPISSLNKDIQIPDFVKELYDEVMDSGEKIRSVLAHPIIANLHSEMKSIDGLELTRQIERKFFGESGNDIHMENHTHRGKIIDIIKNFKEDGFNSKTYENLFPATHRNKSAIMVQLADGEASFTILSQSEAVIKELAQIAGHPNLNEILSLGKDALRRKQQDEAEMQYKKKIGNHLEDVLRKHLSQHLNVKVQSEQDGQDLIVYIADKDVYYIEVKSKWLETTQIRISRNQTIKAFEKSNCFALCSIDMTKYNEVDRAAVESIDKIVPHMTFNTDVGKHVEHLISLYENAHHQDAFSLDGDFRTLIPASYIKKGIDLGQFEIEFIDYIKANHA